MLPEEFQKQLSIQGIELSSEQLKQFATYYDRLIEWNQKMNLTAITDQKEVYLKHFYDSISLAFVTAFKEDAHLCDVGSGAGFPSIPLKIIFPQLKITIVDSLNKRITFLQTLVADLGLKDVYLFHDRAETFGQSLLKKKN